MTDYTIVHSLLHLSYYEIYHIAHSIRNHQNSQGFSELTETGFECWAPQKLIMPKFEPGTHLVLVG